ncbi:hypothetical protein HWI79_2941 [Cryptosporidium felis]|nr:hypothetical protein HWI79_2941 [Cryptosporidium felis]
MSEKGGIVVKIKHSADNYNEDKKDGRVAAKKQIELEQNAAKAIMNLKHRRDCNGEATRFSWCTDPLCRMWYDMSQYFGFLGEDIIDTDIDNAIISVADGGSGIYERLIVLGHRILDATGKEYAVKKYMTTGIEGIPKEINKIIGETNKKLLIFLKMRWLSNNICSVSCLSKFAKRYSHYCRAELNSDPNKWDDIKLSKYIKFCISFCIYGQGIVDWNNPLNVENKLCQRFPWLEILIRSMDFSILNPTVQEDGKFYTPEGLRNMKIMEVLCKYFGYSRNKKEVPPRVLFALNTPEGSPLPEEKTGKMIFSHYISHYFKAVAAEHGLTGVDTLHWVEKEKNILLQSNAIELFAMIDLELGEIYANFGPSKIEEKFTRFKGLFFSLIANMFVLCNEDKHAQMWLQELVTSVRQVQLYLLEYQDFMSSESAAKGNNIPQNEIFTISETSLDHTHVPDIFIDLEPEEVQSFINMLEKCKSPEIVEILREFTQNSKSCVSEILNVINTPQKLLREGLLKIARFAKHKTKKNIGKCNGWNILEHFDVDSDESEENEPTIDEKVKDKTKKIKKKKERKEVKEKEEINKITIENTKIIHCPEALSPILKPVTLRIGEDYPGVEIQPVSLTFIDEKGNPVHYTLNPNSSSIPDGKVKAVNDLLDKNEKNIEDKDRNISRRSRAFHVFSRNIGRSRSPNHRFIEKREHGMLICGDVKSQVSDIKDDIKVYRDNRDYMNYIGYNSEGIGGSTHSNLGFGVSNYGNYN